MQNQSLKDFKWGRQHRNYGPARFQFLPQQSRCVVSLRRELYLAVIA